MTEEIEKIKVKSEKHLNDNQLKKHEEEEERPMVSAQVNYTVILVSL